MSLERAQQLIKAGDKAQARDLLAQVVKSEPDNDTVWLALADCAPSVDAERRYLEKALEVNPVNFDAQKRIDDLDRHLEFKREKKEEEKRGKTAFNIGVAAGVVGIFIFPAVLGLIAIVCGVVAIAMGYRRGTTVILLGILDMVLFFVLLDSATNISYLF